MILSLSAGRPGQGSGFIMAKIDWAYIQAASDDVLYDGFEALKTRPFLKAAAAQDEAPCNYLISLKGEARYIGEGQNAQARLRQQFREGSSTFYKTYLKKTAGSEHAAISDFDVQVMASRLGRKEMEEFGIVHLVDRLNKFQLDKRARLEASEESKGLWDIVQAQHERLLGEGVAAVLESAWTPWFDCAPRSGPGVYLVRHKGRLIYAGESPDLSARHETHSDDTYFSGLRRHIGVELLDCELQDIGGRKRYFTDDQDWKVTRFLTDCEAVFCPVSFGRYELEDRLIGTQDPVLNRKSVAA
jgi:predicted GIY-YIG superfamily endonuclease